MTRSNFPFPAIRLGRAFLTAALFAALNLTPATRADEDDVFGYSEGAESLARGQTEVTQWLTQRTGKADGTYRATDAFTEIEHGFTNQLQGSLYLTAARYHIAGVTGFDDAERTVFSGVRFAVKYELRNPDANGYGLALYVEPEYASVDRAPGDRIDEFGLETKVIYQKEFRGGIYLANLTVEPELARERGRTNHELGFELSHGVSFGLGHGWHAGVETRWNAGFEPVRLSQLSRYAGFVGPTVAFTTKSTFVTFSWLPQVVGWPASRHHLALDEFERNEFRLRVGFQF